MADVFGRVDQLLAGGLSSDSLFMTWPELTSVSGTGGLGLLIQQVSIDYRQNLRRIFEIGPGVIPTGSSGSFVSAAFCDDAGTSGTPIAAGVCESRTQPTYYIVSRPEGTLQLGRFIGPNLLTSCFYRKYGSPCGPNIITMTGKAGCSATDANAKRIQWILKGVTLVGIASDVTGQEMVFQERLSAMFAGLNLVIEGDDPSCGAPAAPSSNATYTGAAGTQFNVNQTSATAGTSLGGIIGDNGQIVVP